MIPSTRIAIALIAGVFLGGFTTSLFFRFPFSFPHPSNFIHPRLPSSSGISCDCDGSRPGGYWDLNRPTAHWFTPTDKDVQCDQNQCIRLRPNRHRDVERVLQCLSTHRRIVMVGDSVHRGMFWSLVNAIQDAIASAKEDSKRSTAPPSFASHLNATVVRRFVSDEIFYFC